MTTSELSSTLENLKIVSIRGRMAYLLCLFEKLLIHNNCKKEDWDWILERLWQYTSVRYFDDWIYEVAELLPENVMQDKAEAFEYITNEEYMRLRTLYPTNSIEVNKVLNMIYELGTIDSYSRLVDDGPNTLAILKEAIDLLQAQGIEMVSSEPFKKYSFSECNGWGEPFEGIQLSTFH